MEPELSGLLPATGIGRVPYLGTTETHKGMARRPHSRWLLLPLGFAVAGCTSIAQVSGIDQQQILDSKLEQHPSVLMAQPDGFCV